MIHGTTRGSTGIPTATISTIRGFAVRRTWDGRTGTTRTGRATTAVTILTGTTDIRTIIPVYSPSLVGQAAHATPGIGEAVAPRVPAMEAGVTGRAIVLEFLSHRRAGIRVVVEMAVRREAACPVDGAGDQVLLRKAVDVHVRARA